MNKVTVTSDQLARFIDVNWIRHLFPCKRRSVWKPVRVPIGWKYRTRRIVCRAYSRHLDDIVAVYYNNFEADLIVRVSLRSSFRLRPFENDNCIPIPNLSADQNIQGSYTSNTLLVISMMGGRSQWRDAVIVRIRSWAIRNWVSEQWP